MGNTSLWSLKALGRLLLIGFTRPGGQGGRGGGDSLVEHADLVSVDDQLVTLDLDLTVETSVGGVVLEHVDLRENEEGKDN